jgi:hypothetical protein
LQVGGTKIEFVEKKFAKDVGSCRRVQEHEW